MSTTNLLFVPCDPPTMQIECGIRALLNQDEAATIIVCPFYEKQIDTPKPQNLVTMLALSFAELYIGRHLGQVFLAPLLVDIASQKEGSGFEKMFELLDLMDLQDVSGAFFCSDSMALFQQHRHAEILNRIGKKVLLYQLSQIQTELNTVKEFFTSVDVKIHRSYKTERAVPSQDQMRKSISDPMLSRDLRYISQMTRSFLFAVGLYGAPIQDDPEIPFALPRAMLQHPST